MRWRRSCSDLSRLRGAMLTAAQRVGSNAGMARHVGLPLADGFAAFANGKHVAAFDAIEPVRDTANGFGGSHAQRDLLTLKMIEAAMRQGDARRARHCIAERRTHKPTAWSERLLARVAEGTKATQRRKPERNLVSVGSASAARA